MNHESQAILFLYPFQYEPPDEGNSKKSDLRSLLTNGNAEKEHRPKLKERESLQPTQNKKLPKLDDRKGGTSSKGMISWVNELLK